MNVLICGDSFAVDYSRYQDVDYSGWPQIIANQFNVTNVAQAGCSEYKIYLQLKQLDLSKFDCVVVFHTSPYRIYVKRHPYLHESKLHHSSDLIYNDIKNHDDFDDKKSLTTFFEKYFDLDYARFVHRLTQQEISRLLISIPSLQIGIDLPELDFDAQSLFKTHRGNVNHFDSQANQILANFVAEWIEQACCM